MTRKELVVAAGGGLLHSAELGSSEASYWGGLYRRPGLTCAEIHSAVSRDLASVATLVMCERDVSPAYPPGISSTGPSLAAALLAYLSAASLLAAPLCAGTHRMVTSLSREDA